MDGISQALHQLHWEQNLAYLVPLKEIGLSFSVKSTPINIMGFSPLFFPRSSNTTFKFPLFTLFSYSPPIYVNEVLKHASLLVSTPTV